MKKTWYLLTVLITVALLGACKSAPPSEEKETGTLSFETVYNKYEARLILDGAVDYEVKAGDTLAAITRKFYGSEKRFGVSNAYFFPLIMLASNDVVLDPDLIEPGMHLSVPDLQRNLDSAAARQAMKEFFADVAGVYERKGEEETRPNLKTLAQDTHSNLLELSEVL
jgi:hypothetical protein